MTLRDIAELSDREQRQLQRYTVDVLERAAARKRRRLVRAEIDLTEQMGGQHESRLTYPV